MEPCLIYITCASAAEAEQLAAHLLEARLVACANILPGMTALYHWESKLERGEEAVLILKTLQSRFDAVRAAVRARHSYTTPAILAVPVVAIDADYRKWLEDEVG